MKQLLKHDFPGRNELQIQAEGMFVREIDENGSLELLPAGTGPDAAVQKRVPTEARIPDTDGMMINLLLHVIDGRLNELEIYRDDSGPVDRTLVPEELKVQHS